MSRLLLAIAAITLVAAGCGGTQTAAHAASWTALGAPKGYRVKHVWRASLTGARKRDIVVSSVGPTIKRVPYPAPSHATDLRVVTWEPSTHRWEVAFDAQKVLSTAPCTPQTTNVVPCASDIGSGGLLLDPQVGTSPVQIRFAHLVSARRDDLVVSTASPMGADGGYTTVLAVVDFAYGAANLAYTWTGARGLRWHVGHRRIHGSAEYYEGIDTPTGAVGRAYHFTVAPRGEYERFVETSDDRAWLGVVTRGSPHVLKVVGLDPYAPAQGKLRVGDLLLKVLNPVDQRWPQSPDGQIRDFRPGQVARLLVKRDGKKMVVAVRLGSLKNALPQLFPAAGRLDGI